MFSKLPFARPLPSDLPSSSQSRLLSWIHMAGLIETENELTQFLTQLQSQLPTRHLALLLCRLNQRQQVHRLEKVLNIGFPQAWMDRYEEQNYLHCDPVLRALDGQGPIHWQDQFAKVRNRTEKLYIADICSHGLGQGISFSALSERRRLACVLSISGGEIGKNSQMVAMLNSLQPHIQQAANRVIPLPPASPDNLPLSQREYDIFFWMSQGKTNWEVATILAISERTVKFHVANIIRKLCANNRTHAIVIGMKQGWQETTAAMAG